MTAQEDIEILGFQWRWAPESPVTPDIEVIGPTNDHKTLRVQVEPVEPYAVMLANFFIRDEDNNVTPVRLRIIILSNCNNLPENDCDADGVPDDEDDDCICCDGGGLYITPEEDWMNLPARFDWSCWETVTVVEEWDPEEDIEWDEDEDENDEDEDENDEDEDENDEDEDENDEDEDENDEDEDENDEDEDENDEDEDENDEDEDEDENDEDDDENDDDENDDDENDDNDNDDNDNGGGWPTWPNGGGLDDGGAPPGTEADSCSRWSFRCMFGEPMKSENTNRDESVFDLGIQYDLTLWENLRQIFYPDPNGSAPNRIWYVLRVMMVGFFVLLFIWAGARFFIYADNEWESSKSRLNLLYIIAGAWVIALTIWILWFALNITDTPGLTWLADVEDDSALLSRAENNLLRMLIGVLKWGAFFAAIVMMLRYGYGMMMAMSSEEKATKAKTWVINVVLALVFIKVIDYLYWMSQVQDFRNRAVELLVEASKILWYLLGVLLVLAAIYAWYIMVTSSGDDGRVTQAKNILKALFVVTLVVLLFMLVVYQIFGDILW